MKFIDENIRCLFADEISMEFLVTMYKKNKILRQTAMF